jgi:hypothetical protein
MRANTFRKPAVFAESWQEMTEVRGFRQILLGNGGTARGFAEFQQEMGEPCAVLLDPGRK